MATRYTAQFSPNASSGTRDATLPFKGRRPMRFGARLNIYAALPVIAAFPSFFQPVSTMLVDMAGAALLGFAAWLTREGIKAEDAYSVRIVARRPMIPRKIMAALICGLAVGLLVWGGTSAILNATAIAVFAGVLHLAAFGIDPLQDKGISDIDSTAERRLADKIEAAEALLQEMRDAVTQTGQRDLEARVIAFQQTAQAMFRQIESDPRDLNAARRFLGVYLEGARDAAVKFQSLYAARPDAALKTRFEGLLNDLERDFAARTTKLAQNDTEDLDLDIELLRERLAREAV